MWAREKQAMIRECQRLDEIMSRPDTDLIISSCYLSNRVLGHWLLEHGFTAGPESYFDENNRTSYLLGWSNSTGRKITTAVINHTDHDRREFQQVARMSAHAVFVNDLGSLYAERLMIETGDWKPVSPSGNGLLAVYERR